MGSFLLITCTQTIVTAIKISDDEYVGIRQAFQHIVRFINVTTAVNSYSYGRRLPGLNFGASPYG